MNLKRKYGDDIIEFIRNHVKMFTDKEIAQMVSQQWNMKVTESAITNLKAKHNIKSGVRRGCFPKGHEPINKGTKGMFNVGGNKTSFKKGQAPLNWVPVGTERINTDGYVMVKVKEDGHYGQRWKLKSRIIYEEHLGRKLKRSEKIMYLDGNPLNLAIDNLKLITDKENAVMNKSRLRFNDAELTEVGLKVARIKMAMSQKKRRNQHAKSI